MDRVRTLHEEQVDIEDDLEVARQEVLQKRDRPLLESLGQNRVVRVEEGLGDDRPGVVPADLLLVNVNAHELDDGKSRVRVVELDGIV